MRFDSVAWGILKRKVLAWLRLKFGTKPLSIPKLAGPVQIWAGVDTDREEADYLRNTTAFWLRPDRGSFDVPCWMIEGEYTPKPVGLYDPATNSTRYRDGSFFYHMGYQNANQYRSYQNYASGLQSGYANGLFR